MSVFESRQPFAGAGINYAGQQLLVCLFVCLCVFVSAFAGCVHVCTQKRIASVKCAVVVSCVFSGPEIVSTRCGDPTQPNVDGTLVPFGNRPELSRRPNVASATLNINAICSHFGHLDNAFVVVPSTVDHIDASAISEIQHSIMPVYTLEYLHCLRKTCRMLAPLCTSTLCGSCVVTCGQHLCLFACTMFVRHN